MFYSTHIPPSNAEGPDSEKMKEIRRSELHEFCYTVLEVQGVIQRGVTGNGNKTINPYPGVEYGKSWYDCYISDLKCGNGKTFKVLHSFPSPTRVVDLLLFHIPLQARFPIVRINVCSPIIVVI